MKRRKFLQILGLSAAAPVVVLASSLKKKSWTKPELKKINGWDESSSIPEWIGYDFGTPVKIQEFNYYLPESLKSKLSGSGTLLPENIIWTGTMPKVL